MGSKFPRPKDIGFPNVENPIEYNISKVSEGQAGKKGSLAFSLCALKSGNILISYITRDEKNLEMKSFLSIYSVPKLKLVEKYEFQAEVNDITYSVVYAIQLKNGNIFSICDKFYFFEGESIADGPKTTSEEVNDISCKKIEARFIDPTDIFKRKQIVKDSRSYLCDFMIEPKEGIVLYTCDTYGHNHDISLLDVSNLENIETQGKKVYSWSDLSKKDSYEFDIIYQSEYYPENLYVIANVSNYHSNSSSLLLIFNSDDFCKTNTSSRKPINKIEVSKSRIVFALLEYDKTYLLLDTVNNGIYIINIETKQKVAVSDLKIIHEKFTGVEGMLMNHYTKEEQIQKDIFKTLYRNMIKLKDGQVLTVYDSTYFVTDINAQQKKPAKDIQAYAKAKFVISGNYIITLNAQSAEFIAIKLYDD